MLETLTFGLKFNQSLEGRGSEQKPELDSMSNSDQEVTQTNIGCQFFFVKYKFSCSIYFQVARVGSFWTEAVEIYDGMKSLGQA